MSPPRPHVDVLVPTCERPAALATVLVGLAGQLGPPFRLVVSDQSRTTAGVDAAEPAAVLRVLRHRGVPVELHRGRPRRGIAEQRAFLLSRVETPFALFLDDDVLLEPDTLDRLHRAITRLGCGFVGAAPQGLSHLGDVRPDDHRGYEPWTEPVVPERVRKGTLAWERWRLHSAANLAHLAAARPPPGGGFEAYKIAWVAGCVLYRADALRAVGGFDFWRRLPPNLRGEDVAVQLRIMERFGGAGILPSGAYHLELPTTLADRGVDAYAEVIEAADVLEREAG